MQIGIAGFTNVGKTTFFSAATLVDAEISDRPFTTIKPNLGTGYVTTKCVCSEFNVKCNPRKGKCVNGIRHIPVKVMDVAGLIPEAYKGKGLGNQFLSELMQADVIILVVDVSGTTNYEGFHTEQRDIAQDVQLLEREIDFWMVEILKKHEAKLKKYYHQKKFANGLAEILSGLNIKQKAIELALQEMDEFRQWKEQEYLEFAKRVRQFGKPMLIAANKIDLKNAEKNLEKLREKYKDRIIVPCCAEAELALRKAAKAGVIAYIPGSSDFEIIGNLNEKQRDALQFIKEKILSRFGSTGVQEALNKAVFELLKCIVVYPVEDANKLADSKGNVLPDAIILPEGATALQLAEKIHSSLAENFIAAIDVRTKRKISKEEKLKMNDVIKIVAKS